MTDTSFKPSAAYPYLSIANHFGLPYAEVLKASTYGYWEQSLGGNALVHKCMAYARDLWYVARASGLEAALQWRENNAP